MITAITHINVRINGLKRLKIRSLKKLLLVAGCWLLGIGSTLFAQTGPGGVGSSSNNLLWLKADAGTSTTTNGNPITFWNDQSGNAMNATQGTANRQPKYVANAMNTRPAVLFNNSVDGVYDYLNLPNGFSNFTAGLSAFIVIRPIAAGNWDNFFNLGVVAENIGLMRNGVSSNIYYEVLAGGSPNGRIDWNAITNGSDQIFNIRHNGGTAGTQSTARLYKNNNFLTSAPVLVPNNIARTNNLIGHDSWGSGDMNCEIAEIIIYNYTINNAQRHIAANYLSTKYGIAISNDLFSYDASHSYDVAGIGMVDASNLHDNATSAGILNLSSPGSLAGGDYLLFGHDNGSTASWTATEAPADVLNLSFQRIAREWRIDETNDVGTVTITGNFSVFPGLPVGYTNRVLLVDSDGDFTSGAVPYTLTDMGSNQFRVTGIDLIDGAYLTYAVYRINNEGPCTAQAIPVGASCSFQIFSNEGATDSGTGDPGNCDGEGASGYAGGDVWFSLTVPASGSVIINTDTESSSQTNLEWAFRIGIAVYSGPCGGPLTKIDCQISPASEIPPGNVNLTISGRTPGETLYIRMWENSNNDNGKFYLCAYDLCALTFTVGGGGTVCPGINNGTVTLSGSQSGASYQYQLQRNGSNYGAPLPGTGSPLTWSSLPAGNYTVFVTNTGLGCTVQMTGSAAITQDLAPAAALGYAYQKTITIDPAQVSGGSDLINFPVLINMPPSVELRTVANGGHVQNPGGWDIIFTDENYNKLDHQTESYTAADGNLVAWVRVPVLSSSVNTVIRILYGNPQISVDPSTSETWSSEYLGVWHLGDLSDATVNGNDGTNNGSTSATGRFGLGVEFNGASRVDIPQNSILEPSDNITVSYWVRRNGIQNDYAKPLWYGRNDVAPWGPYGFEFPGTSDNEILFHVTNGSAAGNPRTGAVIADVTWYYITGTYDGSDVRIYNNNNLLDTDPLTGAIGQYNNIGLTLGNRNTGGQGFRGIIDEVRISSVTRPLGWIQTEYANQNSPATFYTIGTENGCSIYSFTDICPGLPVIYSVPNTAGHTYNWTVVNGVPSSTTGNSITVTWDPVGSGNIQLAETSGACTGMSINYLVTINPLPTPPSGTNGERCGTGTVTLQAGGAGGGENYKWYDALTGGNLLQTNGSTFATPSISSTTSYYVTKYNTATLCESSPRTLVVATVKAEPAVTLGYAYQKTVTIDGSKVQGTNINFPVLINISSSPARDELRTVANGGHVENANGYDIIFSDINYNRLDHDVESYNPVTGDLIVWVRIPTLSAGTNTQIRMFYGNPQISTDQSSTGTWDSGYTGVWHLHNDYLDATLYANDGTNSGTTNVSGKIASGGNFDSANDYIQVGTTGWSSGSGAIETWANTNAAAGTDANYIFGHTTVPAYNDRLQLYLSPSSSDLALGLGVNHTKHTSIGSPFTNGAWYHVALTWNGINYEVFVNGVLEATGTYTGLSSLNSYADIGNVGNPAARTEGWDGIIDEFRVSRVTRSTGWIQTAYNNQNDPSGFILGISGESPNSEYDFEVCENETGVIYSVPNQADHSYAWNVTGGTLVGSGNSVQVNWGAAGTGNISLTITNTTTSCSATSPVYSVVINPNPAPVISGNLTVCPNKTNEIYNTPGFGGRSYVWNVTGGTIDGGQGTNQISVDWGPGPLGTVSVTETINATGCNITANINISITDATAPTITCPGNISVDTDPGLCTATIVVPVPVTGDNCGVASVVNDFNGTGDASGTYPSGTTTVIWTVTDVNSNTATCSMTVTVTDNEDPVITCPVNVTIDCEDDSTPAGTGTATATDNCTPAGNITITYSDGSTYSADPANVLHYNYVITRTWRATDVAGNFSECIQSITVQDVTDPTFTVPADATVCRESDCSYNINVSVTGDVTNEADNCTPSSLLNATFTDDDSGLIDCNTGGFILRTWTLVDIIGNTTTQIQTIWVEPTPTATIVVNTPIICDSSNVNIEIDSPTLSTHPENLSFEIIVTSTDPANLGGTASVDFIITKAQMPYLINGTLINTSDVPIKVAYTVNSRLTGCSGFVPVSDTILVNPTPRVGLVTVADTILCDSTSTTLQLQSSSIFTSGLITFNYIAAATGGVTGFTPNASGLPNGYIITDNFFNPTNSEQTVTYTITPVSPLGCNNGPARLVEIFINPTPRLSVSVPDTVVCDSSTVTITVNDLNGNVAGGTTKVYQLTTTDAGGQVLGVQASGEYPSGTPITDVLINMTNSVQSVTYRFKARIRDDRPGHGGNFCDQGGDTTIVIHVEPTPRVNGTISNDTICNNGTIIYTLTSPTIPYFGFNSLRFNVDIINPYPTEITGYSTRFNLTLSSIITETLNNSSDTARMIMYIITPATTNIMGMQNCPGINDTIRLWINPTPRAIPLNAKPAICSTESTEITLTTPTVMTKGAITFDYTVTLSGGPGDLIGSTAFVQGLIPGDKIVLPYTNTSDTIQWVNYFITPRNILSGCPDGNINIPKVNVHAVPLQALVITTPLLCNGGSEAVLTAYLSKGAKPDSVFWIGPWSYINEYQTSEDSTNIANLKAGDYFVTIKDSLGCRATSDRFVSGAILDSYFSVVDKTNGYGTTCPESADGVLMLKENTSSSGVPPFEYFIIYNSQDTVRHDTIWGLGDPYLQYTTNLAPGRYQLFIYDDNNCVNTNYPEANIIAPDTITVEFEKSVYPGGYNVSCRGYNDGSAWIKTILGGSGGYTYKWSTINGTITGPDTLNRLDNITAGTYYLTTTDMMDCIKVDSVTLLDPEGMDLVSSEVSWSPDGDYNISCYGGSDGFIKLSITGGSGIYTFSWTGPNSYTAATKDISGLKAGTYVCTVLDVNGCILMPMPTFTLTEPDALNISADLSSSTYGSFNINCNQGTGSIDVTVTGGSAGNYFYTWTTTNGSGLVNGQEDQDSLTAGTYHLVVADSNLCFTEQDITLTQPDTIELLFVPTHITCQSSGFDNGSVDLTPSGGIGPYTFIWSNGAITEDISGLTEGYYTVTVTDANGCLKTDSIRINMPAELLFTKTVSDPNGNGFNISCNGLADGYINISTIDGLAPFVFSWEGPDGYTASTKDISGLRAGMYVLSITDANLCTATDTTIMTEPGALSMIFNLSSSLAGGFNINCAGDNTGSIEVLPVNSVGSVSYLWFDGSTANPRNNIPAGEYRIIIEDSNQCQADSSIILTEPDSIKPVFDVTQPWCPDMPDGSIILTVSGGVVGTDYTYLWSDNSTSRDIPNATQGLYVVTISDLNGCSVKDSVYIEPEQGICLIIPNAISPNGDLINDVWNIGYISLYPQMEITIFNRWGETVWRSGKGYPQPWDGRSNGSPLPIDSYHYIIDLHNGSKPLVGNVTIVR